MNRRTIFVLVIALSFLPSGVLAKPAVPVWRDHHPWSTNVATVTVGGVPIQAEIADTTQLQTRGLGYRDGLAPGTGMLFDFGSASPHTFWMKGMRFCLDIIWIEGGQITGAAESVCPQPNTPDADLSRYSSGVPVSYVLEVDAGTMAAHDWGPGTAVQITMPGRQG